MKKPFNEAAYHRRKHKIKMMRIVERTKTRLLMVSTKTFTVSAGMYSIELRRHCSNGTIQIEQTPGLLLNHDDWRKMTSWVEWSGS